MTVIGNLGTDPEMRYTPNGRAVTSFRIAVTLSYTGADGERQSDTEWFSVVAWNQLAELCNQYLSKGRKAYVDGRLRSNTWTGQDGQTRHTNEIVADRVVFLDRPSESPISAEGEPTDQVDIDDLPF
jgi:single-strand DNA-binding protein